MERSVPRSTNHLESYFEGSAYLDSNCSRPIGNQPIIYSALTYALPAGLRSLCSNLSAQLDYAGCWILTVFPVIVLKGKKEQKNSEKDGFPPHTVVYIPYQWCKQYICGTLAIACLRIFTATECIQEYNKNVEIW